VVRALGAGAAQAAAVRAARVDTGAHGTLAVQCTTRRAGA
jgi:hypothetical protein